MFTVAAAAARSIPRRTLAVHSLGRVRYMSQHKPPTSDTSDTPSDSSASNPPTPVNANTDANTNVDATNPEAIRGSVPSLDFSPSYEEQPTLQRTGARSSKDTLTSGEKKRKAAARSTFAMMAVGALFGLFYLGREWEDSELASYRLTRENAPADRLGRTMKRLGGVVSFFMDPVWPELLPPPAPPPQGKPYTLIVSLDDLLVGSTWDRQNGWRTAKRPGVDYFLAYLSLFYEIVLFTTQPVYTAAPIIDKLDKYGFFVTHRLYREATRSINGQVVKDLSFLNRDLSKVVSLDTNPEHIRTHPENAVIIPKWNGDPKDVGLVAMIPFLESIAIYNPADVRPILQAYAGKNIPVEYAKKEAEQKARHIEEWQKKHVKGAASGGLGLASLLGLPSAISRSQGPPPTYLEQKRKEAQMHYLEEQKYLATNKEQLELMLKQDQQAMMAMGANNLWEALGFVPKKEGDPAAAANAPGAPGTPGASVAVPNASSGSLPPMPSKTA